MALESLPVQHPIVCVGPASDSRISDHAVVQFLTFVLGMAMAPRFATMVIVACRSRGGVAALATGALRRTGW
jgi:hypothetical protein